MQKRNSHKKLNGELILMQNDLMSKLANLNEPRRQTDELGFNLSQPKEDSDALLSLISKSKNITKTYAKELEIAKKGVVSKRKVEPQGTFLTGLGLSRQPQVIKSRKEIVPIQNYSEVQEDPDQMLKQLISKNGIDQLEQLRRMIKQTGSNLESCSRKLNKSKKNIMQMADRYTSDVPFSTMNFLNNYRQFQVKKLDEIRYH